MTIGDVLKSYRIKHKISQDKFAAKSGISKGYISMLENNTNARDGKPIQPTIEMFRKLAFGMNIELDELLRITDGNQKISLSADYEKKETSNIENIYPIELKRFPLLGEIACGKPIYTNEDRECYVMAGTNIQADFCLKAKGDSMVNARILDGDIVFIRKQDIVDNGEIAAIVVNNDSEATLKRFYYYAEKGMVILKAENPAYEDMIFTNGELDNFHVLGKAVAFQSDVR